MLQCAAQRNPNELMRFLMSKVWTVRRAIEDRKLGIRSGFLGTAAFEQSGNCWIYQERGEFQIAGDQYAATRRYLYEVRENSILVSFEDGRPFHIINFEQLPDLKVEHLCGEDWYRGQIHYASDYWESCWEVKGPQKDLLIFSSYR